MTPARCVSASTPAGIGRLKKHRQLPSSLRFPVDLRRGFCSVPSGSNRRCMLSDDLSKHVTGVRTPGNR